MLLKKFYLWKGDWAIDSISTQFWPFLNISKFPKIPILKLFGNYRGNSCTMFLCQIAGTALLVVSCNFSEMLQKSKILCLRLWSQCDQFQKLFQCKHYSFSRGHRLSTCLSLLSANPTKWSNTFKQFVGNSDQLFECVWPFCGVGVKG